jgi:hypothetical protein
MPSTQPQPPKKEVALALLERSSVYVHLDPRQGAVIVPVWLKKQPQLVLQVGLNMPVPIPDLKVDDEGMSCTLSFNRAPFYCVVPWSSVFAMVGDDGRGVVWPDDVPAEVARQAQVQAVEGAAQKEAPRPAPAPEKEQPKAPADLSRGGRTPPGSADLSRGGRTPPGSADAAKPKRPRKRAALAAVTDAEPQAAAQKRVAPKPARAAERTEKDEAAAAPVAAPVQAARPMVGAKKKRELPPYLRVVK